MIELTAPANVGLSATRLALASDHLKRYVDDGKIPGFQALISRKGQVAYLDRYGLRDVEAGLPVEEDTIFRIYSMTKPITTVALLILYEQGLFQLDDPVSAFIPAFKDLEVFASGDAERYYTTAPDRAMTIRDLLMHTAGLSYGTRSNHPVDLLYQREKEFNGTLADLVNKLGNLPLMFSPGTGWNYSYATDVVGYLIEVISGRPLDRFFAEHILEPLGMVDTGFMVPQAKVPRFAANYQFADPGFQLIESPGESKYLQLPKMISGGGGLVSTAHDYLRFCHMLLHKGELDGERIIGRKTVELMTSNHLPGNGDLTSMGQAVFSETPYDGIGFGLGVSVMLNPATAAILGSPGEYAWGGAASTAFWIDPVEEMIVIFLTQLMPSSTYPIRRELRVLTYQAIVD